MRSGNAVVIFDFDKTLTTRDSFRLFSLEAAATFRVKAQVIILALFCKLGLLDNAAYKTHVLKQVWIEKNREQRREFLKHFLLVLHRIENDSVVSLLKQHLENNDKVVVMSASPEFYLRPFVQSWSDDIEVFGTKVYDADGRVEVNNLFGESKAGLTKTLIQQHNPESLLVYTDHISDLSLMRLATKVRLVSPSPQCIRVLRSLDIKFETI
jgi:HAD superfamily phosphoserine phosphatase-like hydrolase